VVDVKDILNPEWQVQMASEIGFAEEQAEVVRLRSEAAQATLGAEGPVYWRQFLKEASINTEALQKNPKLGVRGRTSPFGNPRGGEQRCRIEVSRTGIFPCMTWMDLFYTPVDSRIRAYTLEGIAFDLDFSISSTGKGVSIQTDEEYFLADPEALAEMLVKRMVKQVRSAAY